MTDDTTASVDDLFGDDAPEGDAPPAKYDGTVAEFEDAVGDLDGDELASYAEGTRDPRAGIVKAATAELERRAAPANDDDAPAGDDDQDGDDTPTGTDTAARIRKVDWECADCGNTNTHDLRTCGKCRKPRYR